MSGIFSSAPKTPKIEEAPTPMIVDNALQTQDEEKRKKKRRGAASQFVSGENTMDNINVGKTTLG